ncbi:MAG: carboxypeptidase-like regulatory domain-containing protein, partial [Bacteroides sp.]|nr:carboxypeptidase-like regulatory domain-containing protein [Bacteroides sp.]
MPVHAQSGKGSFAGRVVDKETKQPVGYAAVRLLALPDSSFLAGAATKDDGKFKIPFVWPKDKKLLLEISFIGYTPFSKQVPSSLRGGAQDLGDVALVPDGFVLDETVVVGKAPLAMTEQDTTVFNASAYRTPEG